jgi:hypothetical protein
MEVEKNFTSFFAQRGERTFLSFGGSEAQKITRSKNPPIKFNVIGHVMRAKGSLEQGIVLGQFAGYRKQGKPRMPWLDSIKETTGLQLEFLKETVKYRKK